MGIKRKDYDNLSDALDAYKGLHQNEKKQNIAKWNQSKITVNPKSGKFEVGKLTFFERIGSKLGFGSANRKVLLQVASKDSAKTLNKAYDILFGKKVETKFLFDYPGSPLIKAASSGDFTKVLSFLEKPDDSNPYDTVKVPVNPVLLKVAIEAAAANGHTDIVSSLLVQDRNAFSKMCLTAIQVAAEYNRIEVVVKAVELLTKFSQMDTIYKIMGEDTCSAFTAAVKKGNNEIARLLLEKGVVTPPASFVIAAKYGCLSIVELIAKDNEILKRNGQEALREAIDNKQLETVKILLDKGVNIEDGLISLAANGSLESFKSLLKVGSVKPETLQTARIIAEESNNYEVSDYLKNEKVANPSDLSAVFIYAAKHGHDKAVKHLMNEVNFSHDTMKAALSALMDGDKRNFICKLMKKNQSAEIAGDAIIEAAKKNRWFLFKHLSQGARHLLDDKAKNDVFGQALITAAKNGHKDTVKQLISMSNLDAQDSEGKTAYQYAIEIADVQMKNSLAFYYNKKI